MVSHSSVAPVSAIHLTTISAGKKSRLYRLARLLLAMSR
uniref:Uncharacterized protein n=1 Tax=Peduovirinae sp. ctjOQ18 TaxID=2825161 RepID=A0A8S5P0E8_9CAUD|nr:MAG TPA: hypothetical protein [Peduovirinae sp. ctjOQ18]